MFNGINHDDISRAPFAGPGSAKERARREALFGIPAFLPGAHITTGSRRTLTSCDWETEPKHNYPVVLRGINAFLHQAQGNMTPDQCYRLASSVDNAH